LKPSRFNLTAWDTDERFLVFNSLTGGFLAFFGDDATRAAGVLEGAPDADVGVTDPVVAALAANGAVVSAGANELRRAENLHGLAADRTDHLRLIVMPTEKCNFRCVYCYEDFVRGRMPADIRRSLVRFVERECAALRTLQVSWFGGEPLIALDVMEDLSHGFRGACREAGVSYSASVTTNGYLLTPEVAKRCFAIGVARFQVTLDGPPATHNALRVLAGGGPTFDTIAANLRALRAMSERYEVRLRINYTPAVAGRLPEFLRFLGDEFGGDDRFVVNCHAVGHWGGPNDDSVETCDERTSQDVEVQFMQLAADAGFSLDYWQDSMSPYGSVCYAADPRSFVIGSDGVVYKCTVALDDPRNRIGAVQPDGSLAIAEELHALWISSGEEQDTGCQQCAFRPACQGNHCPLARLQTGQKSCPPVKQHPDKYLPVLATTTRPRIPVTAL